MNAFWVWYILIKSYSASELGLEAALDRYEYNVRHKVFHIWYLPIFPVEKNAQIKEKQTGKIFFGSTPEMLTALNLKILKVHSPLWTYIGIFVLCPPLFLFLGHKCPDMDIRMLSNGVRSAISGEGLFIDMAMGKNSSIDQITIQVNKLPPIFILLTPEVRA